MYQNTPRGLELKQRLDWALPHGAADLEQQRAQSNLDAALGPLLTDSESLRHIIIKDLKKGVLCPEIVKWLAKHFSHAFWYISTKDWKPTWLAHVPKERIRLLTIPQLAARKAIESGEIASSSWITGGNVPARDALKALERISRKILPQGTHHRTPGSDAITRERLVAGPAAATARVRWNDAGRAQR